MKLNKNLLIVGVLVVLVLVSAVQAVQLNDMRNNVNDLGTETTIKSTSVEPSLSSSSGSTSIPTNLQNLPGMVGGC